MDRPPPPPIDNAGDEPTLLTQFLDFYRAALLDRAYGLDPEQMHQAHPPATLTLARLIAHMIMVEHTWFTVRFLGHDMPEPWASELDWDADRDAEMTLSESWTAAELLDRFNAVVDHTRAIVADAESFDQLTVRADGEGKHWDLRWIMIHMIEEYARHTGHADLIREAIDGNTAE